jgi:D-3-phosphoglycerate dehydrogenase
MTLMLASMRNIPQANSSLRSGRWERLTFMGNHLEGKLLGLIGFGRVGQLVAARARAFGMTVIAFDPYVSEELADALKVELVETLDDLLTRADVISLHVQLTDETRGMIGVTQIAQMKRGVRIINTARGALIDEVALLGALESGQVGGAALDVFVTEPVEGLSASLVNHPHVVATPHLGASTFEAQRDVSIRIAQQVLDALRGHEYRNVVNLPFEDQTDFAMLTPFMHLAEKVGAFQMQLMQARPPMQIEIAVQGELIRNQIKPLTVALLKGLLSPQLGDEINYVNAPYLSRVNNISVRLAALPGMEDYANVIACRVTAGDEVRLVAGTCLTHAEPRIVRVDEIPMDVLPEGWILAIKSHDAPGVIGQVATLLGVNKLNIAEYRLGRDHAGGTAYSFVNLDSKAPINVLEQLRALDPVIEVKQVNL